MEFLIITGLSGAGKTRAADVLEDQFPGFGIGHRAVDGGVGLLVVVTQAPGQEHRQRNEKEDVKYLFHTLFHFIAEGS